MPALLASMSRALRRSWRQQPPAQPAARSPAPRLSVTEQWSQLVDLIMSSIERTATGHSLHVAAGTQIDAAAYALNAIMDDLSAIMPLPSRRSPANLHHLRQPSTAISGRSRVAAAA